LTTPPIASTQSSDFKSHVKSISHQSSVFLFGTLFSGAAAYFFKIYLARVLGAEALGIYALGMTVVGLAGVLAAGGLPQAASRFVAVYSATDQALKLGRFLWSSLAVLVISNLLAGFLIVLARPWIAGPLYHTPALASYLHLFIPIMLTGSLTTFLGLALAGFKDVARRTVITNFVGQILTMAFSVALLTAGFGLTGYLVAQIASAVVVLLLLGWATWKLSPPPARRPSLGLPILESEVVSFSVTFFGVQVLTFLLSQTDKVLLGVYINPREVGIYSIAATLVAFRTSGFAVSESDLFPDDRGVACPWRPGIVGSAFPFPDQMDPRADHPISSRDDFVRAANYGNVRSRVCAGVVGVGGGHLRPTRQLWRRVGGISVADVRPGKARA
jgi:O-antigen/teichoic acid export membrane protein